VFFARLVVEQTRFLYRVLYDFAGDLRALFLVSALAASEAATSKTLYALRASPLE